VKKLTFPQPKGLEVQQPRASPWVIFNYLLQSERLLEASCSLSGCINRVLPYPGRCPGLLQFTALWAEGKLIIKNTAIMVYIEGNPQSEYAHSFMGR